jgi:hypothetical protein
MRRVVGAVLEHERRHDRTHFRDLAAREAPIAVVLEPKVGVLTVAGAHARNCQLEKLRRYTARGRRVDRLLAGAPQACLAALVHPTGHFSHDQSALERELVRAVPDPRVVVTPSVIDAKGMGSTVVAAQLSGSSCTIAWVGDSRAYLWRRDRLQAVSRDHSLVEGLREQQGLSDTEVREHPNRHMVTQTLGLGNPVPSRKDVRLRAGDWILLCSDGLNDELTDTAIAEVLRANPTLEGAGDALIAAALEHGGNDNVSVVLVAYDGRGKGEPATPLQARTIVLLSVVAGVTVALAVAALWWLLYGKH